MWTFKLFSIFFPIPDHLCCYIFGHILDFRVYFNVLHPYKNIKARGVKWSKYTLYSSQEWLQPQVPGPLPCKCHTPAPWTRGDEWRDGRNPCVVGSILPSQWFQGAALWPHHSATFHKAWAIRSHVRARAAQTSKVGWTSCVPMQETGNSSGFLAKQPTHHSILP